MNRTLKTMLRKHAVKLGPQWDNYLPGVLWAYRNTPHEEKPWAGLTIPTEAALLEPPTDIQDYRQELILSLSSARELVETTIGKQQQLSKERYDMKSVVQDLKVIHFP